jgi:tRNA pseudouridine38-40 synthase
MKTELTDSSFILPPSSFRNIALELEYDGTQLVGSQFQTSGRTVQGELEGAWSRFSGEQIRWNFAGRTDAGVHARGQVVNARTASQQPLETVQRALNALLPQDIAVRRAWDVPYEFHARYSAVRRDYRYLLLMGRWRSPLLQNRAVHIDQPLDVGAMAQALDALVGVHDFAAFGSTPDGPTVRECFVATCGEIEENGTRLIAIDLAASGFLRHMVRTIVGTLVLIGRGKLAVTEMARILASRDRDQAGPTAPPHGLYLMSVTYPDVCIHGLTTGSEHIGT